MTSEANVDTVFVDFENVPMVDLEVVEGKSVRVTLLIGKKQTKLDLALVQQIHRLGKQVELIEVGASGHNALDLTLGYYLGRAVVQSPQGQFFIVSKDKDFDPLIAHLKTNGVQVSRHDSFSALPFLVPLKKNSPAKPTLAPKSATQAKPKPSTDKLEKFIAHLRNSPPANRTKLEHMITAYFKPSLPVGGMKGVIAELLKRGVISVDATGKVSCS